MEEGQKERETQNPKQAPGPDLSAQLSRRPSVEHVTLDLRVMSSSPTLGVEIILK